MRTAIYARVSTSDQSCELQLRELRSYCLARGWANVKEYVDSGVSGASTRKRLAFKELMKDAGQRKFDVVICWKLDRFGRSVPDLSSALQQLASAGVRFLAVSQNIDTDQSNPASALLLNLLCAIAAFERETIRERVGLGYETYRADYASGKAVASKSGKNLPVGRPKRVFDRLKAESLQSQGVPLRQIAKQLGVSVGTVFNNVERKTAASTC